MATDISAFLKYLWMIPVGILVIFILIKLVPRYKIAPPDTALIISGFFRHKYKVRSSDGSVSVKRFGYRIVRGGATFYIPAIERVDKLDMCLMQVDIRTAQPVPTKEYISVLVDAVANIKIGSDDLSIATAAEQLLHYNAEQIKGLAKDVLEGNMREIIGQMTISELIQNRDKFAQESIKAAMSDMQNMGLEIINLTIQNFSDNEGKVIDTMAIQNVVIKEQEAAIAKAEQESNKAQIAAQAAIAEQNKQLQLLQAQYKIEADQEKAKADQAYAIEQERVRKEFEEQRAAAELTRLERATELKRQEVEIERERLNVEVREKAAAEKDTLIFKAEAERVERQAQADAQLYEAQLGAEAIRLRGEAEAEAIRKKAEAMQLYGQAAMLEMVVDKLPEIARSVSEPLSKTEKIILFGEGGATSMARDTAGTMLQTFEAVKQAVGLDIPRMLKDVTTGGLVGKAAPEESETSAEAVPSSDDSQVQE